MKDKEKDIQHLADQLHIDGFIADDIRQISFRRNAKPARYYLHPKVHKKGIPVVLPCGSATNGMSELVDFFLLPCLPNIPYIIKDKEEFTLRIRNIIDLPSDVLLVTFDVMSLHPSIEIDFCLRALNVFLFDSNLPTKVVNGIYNMKELVLNKNVLEFNYECFLQTSVTAIGTNVAPAYANIDMSILERSLVTGSCYEPLVWFR